MGVSFEMSPTLGCQLPLSYQIVINAATVFKDVLSLLTRNVVSMLSQLVWSDTTLPQQPNNVGNQRYITMLSQGWYHVVAMLPQC